MMALLSVAQTLAIFFVLPLVSTVLPPILVLMRGHGSLGRRWMLAIACVAAGAGLWLLSQLSPYLLPTQLHANTRVGIAAFLLGGSIFVPWILYLALRGSTGPRKRE
ncbi:MAG: hypothetical protein ACHQJ7_02690 [Vicinamibacteria bacterium]|jgi:hypothetical protein